MRRVTPASRPPTTRPGHVSQSRWPPPSARPGGAAVAVACDLSDAAAALFDAAETAFDDPVRILVNNATGWVGDSFTGAGTDHVDRQLRPVSADTHDQQFAVDARAGGLLISELAQRNLGRGDASCR